MRILAILAALALACAACVTYPDDADRVSGDATYADAVRDRFSTDADAGFFDAPFPIETLRRADGTVRWERLPPPLNPLLNHYIEQADTLTRGFSAMGPYYLPFTGDIDAAGLPIDAVDSLSDDAPVVIVNIDPNSPDYGRHTPPTTKWYGAQTLYVPAKTLAVLPYQGAPLAEGAWHALIVFRELGDARGRLLESSRTMDDLRAGRAPDGTGGDVLVSSYARLWDWCDEAGVDPATVAVAAVFRTGVFTNEMRALRNATVAIAPPTYSGLTALVEYDGYTVIEGRTELPIWQDGERPYWTGGGGIAFENGEPVMRYRETVRFAVSVPKTPMPPGGFPLLFFANGQGGTYTQVFDRAGDGDDTVPGQGPGALLAERGIAAMDIEAPTVGPRHPDGSFSGIEFFNFWNLTAFRDNVRQAASEFSALANMAGALVIPAVLTPDAEVGDGARFDADRFFLWGQSTGASIAELALAAEPRLRAGVLSGAGVSWNYNLAYKSEPFPFRVLLQLLVDPDFDEYHPVAALFQNVLDPSEAAYFARRWYRDPFDEDRALDILLVMGVYDGYFPPHMVDGLTAAAGLDATAPAPWPETADALALGGGEFVVAPVTANRGGRTAVTASYPQPQGIDGHYVAFVREDAMHQWSCFLESAAKDGVATLPAAVDDRHAPCDPER